MLLLILAQPLFTNYGLLGMEKVGFLLNNRPVILQSRFSEKEKKHLEDDIAKLNQALADNYEWMIDFIERHRKMVHDPDKKIFDLRAKLIALRVSNLNPRVSILELLINDIDKNDGDRSALEQYQLKMWKDELQELKRIQRIAPMPHEPKHEILQPFLRGR